jgi:hypothetical protein
LQDQLQEAQQQQAQQAQTEAQAQTEERPNFKTPSKIQNLK